MSLKTSLVLLILIGILTLSLNFQLIHAQNNSAITINSDGSIAPTTAPINQIGSNYVLTGDINGTITLNKSNIVLDGQGFSLFGPSKMTSSTLLGGMTLNQVSNVTIKNFHIQGGVFGIGLTGYSNLIVNNSIEGVGNGIFNIDEATAAISIGGGNSNSIIGNQITNNIIGILLGQTSNNTIILNTISSSSGAAISVNDSPHNNIYHNNFENNGKTVYDYGSNYYPATISSNTWDNGYPSGGNYWSDYNTKYPQAHEIDDTRIAEIAYTIDAQNVDHYPLLNPYGEFYFIQASLPQLLILTPTNQTYGQSEIALNFTLNKSVNQTSYSLDGGENATIIGNSTLLDLSEGSHEVTVYAMDAFGQIGASQTVTFSITQILTSPQPSIPEILIAVISVIIIIGIIGLLVYIRKKTRRSC